MPLINCPVCNQEISDKAKICPKCGHPIKSEQRKETIASAISVVGEAVSNAGRKVSWKRIIIVIAIVTLMVVLLVFVFKSFLAKVFLNKYEYDVYDGIKRLNECFDLHIVPRMAFGTYHKNKENIMHYTIVGEYDSEEFILRMTLEKKEYSYSVSTSSDYYYKIIDDKIENRDNNEIISKFGVFGTFDFQDATYRIDLSKSSHMGAEVYNNEYGILFKDDEYVIMDCSSAKISFFL